VPISPVSAGQPPSGAKHHYSLTRSFGGVLPPAASKVKRIVNLTVNMTEGKREISLPAAVLEESGFSRRAGTNSRSASGRTDLRLKKIAKPVDN
jgi:hypothetical protein